jgi:hypothetical protein
VLKPAKSFDLVSMASIAPSACFWQKQFWIAQIASKFPGDQQFSIPPGD